MVWRTLKVHQAFLKWPTRFGFANNVSGGHNRAAYIERLARYPQRGLILSWTTRTADLKLQIQSIGLRMGILSFLTNGFVAGCCRFCEEHFKNGWWNIYRWIVESTSCRFSDWLSHHPCTDFPRFCDVGSCQGIFTPMVMEQYTNLQKATFQAKNSSILHQASTLRVKWRELWWAIILNMQGWNILFMIGKWKRLKHGKTTVVVEL